ncbi:hypothetical protein DL96DRAFT_1666670 [Flagelloscypha sp. PMI_526]|nr:hypothetical protein DL96DRAFT_1666670 [Flagelloscypha sp. PMI_526]
MSLAPQQISSDPSFTRGHSGKTPPPAPSAAYAKRARELQAGANVSESLNARYRPPALRALASGGSPPNEAAPPSASDGSPLPPSNYPPGFRRARAGTLPSNVQLAAQRFAAASTSLGTNSASTESLLEQRLPAPAPIPQSLNPVRPNLRHSASVASGVASGVPERNSRLRSGSLTLPSKGISNAFGSNLFSSSWLSNSNGSGFAAVEELRSATTADDEFDVHTLDYLGLDDSHRPPPAATISELRNQAQAAIAGNLAGNPSRLRATTVSNPYRSRPSVPSALLAAPAPEDEEAMYDEYEAHYGRDRLGIYDTTRPRAISTTDEGPVRTLQRRATTADLHPYMGDLTQKHVPPIVTNPSPAASGLLGPTSRTLTQSVHYPVPVPEPAPSRASAYLIAPGSQNRSVSPKAEAPASQIQTPSRSLWIGNLDSAFTSEQLIHVFAPYGAIESLRLLPEKECGFVNFVDQSDAIRAKDDVLNRLGGNIGMANGQAVRIGFGKADSAPVAPAKGGPTSPGPSAPSLQSAKALSNGNLAGLDAQLQSTPTRALWIGSIPSTTTPATILSVFSPYGPIESARVLTHKNCGFINFERLDDAVRARKALNGRDVLGSDVGAIRIGFAKVPVKGGQEGVGQDENANLIVQGVGELSVGGASTIPADQQVLGGAVENYRSNLLLSMIASGGYAASLSNEGVPKPAGWTASVTEQQMIMKELSGGSADAEADIQALAEFRPPTMYYTTIPLVSERANNRRWDASKLRELRKRLDSGTMTVEDIDGVAGDFMDGEIVDLASDWLGNTVVQKLFEKCSPGPRFAMLERLAPHLAMIGIHKNGTWAAQKIIECVQTPEEISLIAQNLRAYAPPLLLDQFGNYVVQCCLRFGAPSNDFIFDAIVDRMWEVAQGRFGARSMRACLESPHITLNQQRRIATAIILNSIPLATNPNGALLLTWLLDTSGFPCRYQLLAPRFTPHLSHLCTHKLASLTVLRIVNQKIEPEASLQVVDALFSSPGDHVLTDVLGDQVNGVAVVHKILTSPFLDPAEKHNYIEATKRVLIELKVIATQAYRRLIEEVGLPVPNFQPAYPGAPSPGGKTKPASTASYVPGLPQGYPSSDQGLASMMAALQMGGQNPQAGPPQLQVEPNYNGNHAPRRVGSQNGGPPSAYSPDTFNPFSRSPAEPQMNTRGGVGPRRGGPHNGIPQQVPPPAPYAPQPSSLPQANAMLGQPSYGSMSPPAVPPPHMYQPYMYQAYQNPASMGTYNA